MTNFKKDPDLVACLKAKFQDVLRNDRSLAESLYASLCNQEYVHKKTGYTFFPSWRVAGGIVADIRDLGEDYIAFYCSGGENGVYKSAYKLIKKCGWVIKKLTLTERIDYRRSIKKLKKDLKGDLKRTDDERAIKLLKMLLEHL